MRFRFQVSGFKLTHFDFLSNAFRYKKFYIAFFISCILFSACSVPTLEKPECDEARETVKQFYSIHFGYGLKPNLENLKKSEVFLTQRLFSELNNQNETAIDYFTQTEDYPKAFRVGGCEVAAQNKTVFEILLFWRDDARNEQREIKVETVNENGRWLIDKVESKQ